MCMDLTTHASTSTAITFRITNKTIFFHQKAPVATNDAPPLRSVQGWRLVHCVRRVLLVGGYVSDRWLPSRRICPSKGITHTSDISTKQLVFFNVGSSLIHAFPVGSEEIRVADTLRCKWRQFVDMVIFPRFLQLHRFCRRAQLPRFCDATPSTAILFFLCTRLRGRRFVQKALRLLICSIRTIGWTFRGRKRKGNEGNSRDP